MNKGIRQKIGGDTTEDKARQNNVLYHFETCFQKPGENQKSEVDDRKIQSQLAPESKVVPSIIVQTEKPVQRQIPILS